jgi:hypothetical protein
MKETVNFNLKTLDKVNYLSTINTSFNQLGVINQPPPAPTSDESVAEFFDLYNQLFYQIPEKGPELSHEYLIKQSSQYINFTQNDENIQALQDEIALLREDLLDANQQIAKLELNSVGLGITLQPVSDLSVQDIINAIT